ncbi:hypothetical protein OIU74_017106 [Salix koriyanagi]|uniref:Uncharacterized protein n=1 Tax=Salix koriyanagi TaxID=2511006 RepID=A0A9Q0PHW3_9ROSI|nr:hypothetical protein OIU74_017106 [Salix koriyanagi]
MITRNLCFDTLVCLCIAHKEFDKNCTCTLPFQPVKWNCSGFSCIESGWHFLSQSIKI